jgi:hypothetical protein
VGDPYPHDLVLLKKRSKGCDSLIWFVRGGPASVTAPGECVIAAYLNVVLDTR